MQARRIPIELPGDLYQRLERLANAQDRDAHQQARWLLREAIERHTGTDDGPRLIPATREAAHAGT